MFTKVILGNSLKDYLIGCIDKKSLSRNKDIEYEKEIDRLQKNGIQNPYCMITGEYKDELNLYKIKEYLINSKIYVTIQYFILKSNQLYFACFLHNNQLSFIPKSMREFKLLSP